MIPVQELALVLGALALYAADATRLLFADELVLERRGRRWTVHEGTPFLLAGRRPMVPRLLRPASPLLLVPLERLVQSGHRPAGDAQRFLDALRPLGWRATVLLLLFFPVLPLVLRGFGPGVELLAWLLAVYGLIGSMAWRAWQHRRVLGLRRWAWLALVLEGVLCPPLAVNIVRKLGLRTDLVGLDNAWQVLGAQGCAQLSEAATRRIDELLACLEPGAPGVHRLAEQRLRLQGFPAAVSRGAPPATPPLLRSTRWCRPRWRGR